MHQSDDLLGCLKDLLEGVLPPPHVLVEIKMLIYSKQVLIYSRQYEDLEERIYSS